MLNQKNYPKALIAVELPLQYNQLKKRADIVVFNPDGKPEIIVECKAAEIQLSDATIQQIAQYNWKLQAKYLVISNGIDNYCFKINYKKRSFENIKDLPNYKSI